MTTVTARAIDPLPGEVAGVTVRFDGDAPQDRTPPCDMSTDPLCPGEPAFDFYSLEVVHRIGYDSFTPDHGVLIAKNKDREGRTCGYNCFTWVIDAHPEDINMVDYVKPDGTKVMRTIADYRQLNDALFHAGLNSGSEYEWIDEPNRLHFYVIARSTNDDGILSYRLAVRSLDGAGAHARGVALGGPPSFRAPEGSSVLGITVSNTGTAAAGTDGPFASDLYRLSVSTSGDGWEAALNNALSAVPFGRTSPLPVQVTRTRGAAPSGVLTVTAVSESDPTKRATVQVSLQPR